MASERRARVDPTPLILLRFGALPRPFLWYDYFSSNQPTMTLTERNQRLYDLRKRLAEAQLQVAWVETEIMAVNQQYKDAQRGDLFQEMFGEPQTLWEHLDRLG